ncbi:Uncharacterized protein NF27_GZ00110 [Candidatus Jidaibacter acanthamoeba]|uniref:Uncharacterized protein n=1 Tax=Candidatus Jidaibacter acanthamoebae TaxID=86105 RepID=A0A0C1MXM1_9RICK|nr:ankyrin repeat domain-containing protein [Candidatus Jidaibacter acanthamoeba]KIE04651.1 Uncharacterized protein NF27_GZ00110 [Candidatus Jidaibacter acanthamoeba]
MKNSLDTKATVEEQENLLLKAVKNGKFYEVKNLLRKLREQGIKINLNARDENGSTALMLAAYQKYEKIIKLLIKNGADVNVQTGKDTVLIVSIFGGNSKIVQMLLARGALINVRDKDDNTPLMIAEKLKNNEVIKHLKKAQLRINQELITAVEFKNYNEVNLLINRGADVNFQDSKGRTALMCAALKERIDIAQILIENGADINAMNNYYQSALLIAAQKGNIAFIKMFIEEGVDLRNEIGGSVLWCAVFEGHEKLVEILIDKGIEVLDPRNANGDTALMVAINKGYINIAKILIENGADIHVANHEGITPLMCASFHGHTDIAGLLIKNEADVNTKSVRGKTALLFALYQDHKDLVKILIDHGSKIDAQDNDGYTNLMHAIIDEQLNAVKFLIKKKADLNLVNSSGYTALMLAAQKNLKNIVKTLIQGGAEVNYMNNWGFTCIALAANESHLSMMNILIKNGANIIDNVINQGILANVVENGDIEIAKIFLEAGVDVNTSDRYEKTILMIAVEKGYEEMIDILIENQVDLDQQHRTGRTALMLAIMMEKRSIATKLILAGASLRIKDCKNNDAFTLLKEKKYYDLLKLIKIRKPNYLINTIAYVPCNDRELENESSDEDISGEYEEHMFEFDTSNIKSLPFKTFKDIKKDEPKQKGPVLGTLIRGDIKPRISKQGDNMESYVIQPFLEKLAAKAFYEPDSSKLQRVAVSFVLNRPRSLSTRRNHCLFSELEVPIDTSIEYNRFGLFWEYEWYDNKNNIVSFKEVRSFYKQLKRYDEQNGTNKAETFREINEDKVEHIVPYQALRERLKNHENTKELVTRFRSHAPNIPIYFGIVDSDVISFNRILLSYDQIYLESKLLSTAIPVVMTTGYEFPAKAIELPENFDSKIKEMVPALKVASQFDRITRIATAKALPLGVYYPEPNLYILLPDQEETIPESFIDRKSKEGSLESKVLLKQVKKREGISKESFIFSAKNPLITMIPDRAARYIRTSQKNYIRFSEDFKKEKFQRILIEDITALKEVTQTHVRTNSWANYLFTHKVGSLGGRGTIISDISGSYTSGHPLFCSSIEKVREQARAIVSEQERLLITLKNSLLPKEKIILIEAAIKSTHLAIAKFILEKIELFSDEKTILASEKEDVKSNHSFRSDSEILKDMIQDLQEYIRKTEEERMEIEAEMKIEVEEVIRQDNLLNNFSEFIIEFKNIVYQMERGRSLFPRHSYYNSQVAQQEEIDTEKVFKAPESTIGKRKRVSQNDTGSIATKERNRGISSSTSILLELDSENIDKLREQQSRKDTSNRTYTNIEVARRENNRKCRDKGKEKI